MANQIYNAAKVALTKTAVEAYVAENPGKKVAIAFDTREQAAHVYEWFHAEPRNDCTAVITYFEDDELKVYNP